MFYTANPFDRADQTRKDEATINTLWTSSEARVVPFYRGLLLVHQEAGNTSQPSIATMAVSDIPSVTSDPVFLGFYEESAYFAQDFSTLESPDALIKSATAEFLDLRVTGPFLTADEGAILSYTRAMIHWQQQTQFCSLCGHANLSRSAGHVKVCSNSNCARESFPRTDPAVIMLVATSANDPKDERCLLGRHPKWPNGVYSTLAGFVEPGETLESAVSREVFEEAGIDTNNVQYVASQPWPFPQSIMLGFTATALNTEIKIDPQELGDAQWFSRDELTEFGNWGDDNYALQLPRPDSIARFLIDRWLKS